MNNNLLLDELNNIQVEYRTILINALKNISDNDADAVVDEIGVFGDVIKNCTVYITLFISTLQRLRIYSSNNFGYG